MMTMLSILILTSNKEYNFFYQQKEKDSYLVWRCTFNILDVRLHHNCFITLLTKGFRMNYFLIHRLCICPSSNYFAWISMIILFADVCVQHYKHLKWKEIVNFIKIETPRKPVFFTFLVWQVNQVVIICYFSSLSVSIIVSHNHHHHHSLLRTLVCSNSRRHR